MHPAWVLPRLGSGYPRRTSWFGLPSLWASKRSAFQCRTASDFEEAAPIGVGSLVVAFGDVETLGGFMRPSRVPYRNPEGIELLMPKLHRFSEYDCDYDNDSIRCSTSSRLVPEETPMKSRFPQHRDVSAFLAPAKRWK